MGNPAPSPKKGVKTRLQNLIRHSESGRYYARIWSNGKEVWKSLESSHLSVAEAHFRSSETSSERVDVEVATADAKITVGQAAVIFFGQVDRQHIDRRPFHRRESASEALHMAYRIPTHRQHKHEGTMVQSMVFTAFLSRLAQ